MGEVSGKSGTIAEYPYHLPDKPWPVGKNGKISYEEFLEWADEDTLAEWVDGEIIMTSPASATHQRIAGFLYRLLYPFSEIYDLGEVFQPPIQMKLPDARPGREPDLIFVAKANASRVQPTFVDGPGDMVVEVVSPESVERDRYTKFQEYAAGGVPEYWLIDPTRNQAEFYRLNQPQQYELMPIDSEGKVHSVALPGFWLRPEWLWRNALPSAERVLKTICGPAYEAYLHRQFQNQDEL